MWQFFAYLRDRSGIVPGFYPHIRRDNGVAVDLQRGVVIRLEIDQHAAGGNIIGSIVVLGGVINGGNMLHLGDGDEVHLAIEIAHREVRADGQVHGLPTSGVNNRWNRTIGIGARRNQLLHEGGDRLGRVLGVPDHGIGVGIGIDRP